MGCCATSENKVVPEPEEENTVTTTSEPADTESKSSEKNAETTLNIVPNKGKKEDRDAMKAIRVSLESKITEGDVDAVKEMITDSKNSKAINYIDPESGGTTLLMFAIQIGKPDMVQLLIDSKADVNAEDSRYHNALFRAVENHSSDDSKEIKISQKTQIESIEILLEAGMDINKQTSDKKETYLMCAAGSYKDEIVDYLIKKKASLNTQDWNKQTALHIAAKSKYVPDMEEKDPRVKIIISLLKSQVDATIEDKWGETALELCQRKKK